MPEDIQLEMLQSIPGLEHCKMVRPAYSVDYDYIPATQLFTTLQSKKNEGLFLAGQVRVQDRRSMDGVLKGFA
jgi:tRNA uridine 5-carboxymethylaminomethyl modification enzyme